MPPFQITSKTNIFARLKDVYEIKTFFYESIANNLCLYSWIKIQKKKKNVFFQNFPPNELYIYIYIYIFNEVCLESTQTAKMNTAEP